MDRLIGSRPVAARDIPQGSQQQTRQEFFSEFNYYFARWIRFTGI
jgi:hypothetical protein